MKATGVRNPRRALAASLALLTGLVAAVAHAECTDQPQPGVDWRRCYLDNRRFVETDLTGANLRDAFLARSTFVDVNFSRIDGRRAKFDSAVLKGARFDEARLIGIDFTNADLTGASFRGADLRNAHFFRAILRDADFTNARLDGADFLNADLSGATWTDGTRVCPEGSIGQCD